MCTCKFKQLYNVFLHRMKLSGHRMRIKFDKEPLPLEKNNYTTKIVKAYVVYDLDSWPNNPHKNFPIINLLV